MTLKGLRQMNSQHEASWLRDGGEEIVTMATGGGENSRDSVNSGTTNSRQITLEDYRLLEAQHKALQERYDHLTSVRRSIPQQPPINFYDHRSPSSSSNSSEDDPEDNDDDETSSLELDENFEPVRTYRSDRHDSGQLPSVSSTSSATNSFRDFGNTNGVRNSSLPDTTVISPELFSRIVNDHIRLKKKFDEKMQQWRKDNATGRNSIDLLRRDVARLKYENENLRKLQPSEDYQGKIKKLEEKIKTMEEEKKPLIEQMQVFKEDFEKERDVRMSVVKKFDLALKQMKRLKEQNEVLTKENYRLKGVIDRSQQVPYYGPRPMPWAPVQMATGLERPRCPVEMPYSLSMEVQADSATESEASDSQTPETSGIRGPSPPSEARLSPTSKVRLSPTEAKEDEELYKRTEDDKITRLDPTGSEALKKYEDEKKDGAKTSSDEEC